ncbi:MAG: tRNA (adenosine(37)-N6)-threonylcarbamoyltransferase complex ATPase subunit type 1 TsaE [Dehalococcoidia bacterium]|nr:tRNA (adenosine(37)-N6)-threonylcarbamoyltransferase complex ATPase subunit type 1 TsaE [Dehalococcoidia bacterium]
MNNDYSLHIISDCPKQTQNIGIKLGRLSQEGDVLLLTGNLGAGKTCLTQGIARGLDIQEYTSSPSFMVVKEYYGRLHLYHIDLYRLEQTAEILDLGLDDYLYGEGICVVEWADREPAVLPEENLLIKMSYISDSKRYLEFEARGERYSELLSELHSQLSHQNGDRGINAVSY